MPVWQAMRDAKLEAPNISAFNPSCQSGHFLLWSTQAISLSPVQRHELRSTLR